MVRIRRRCRGGRDGQSGYMLLFLMLAVAMLCITMLSVARNYRRSILRDREVEMIHRGTQYERAVRLFYKKIGSYPTSVNQLLQTNNIRFLRKKYKDPMTPDGEWQIAHISDLPPDYAVALGVVGGVGGQGGLTATPATITGTQLQGTSGTLGSGGGALPGTQAATTPATANSDAAAGSSGTPNPTTGAGNLGGTPGGAEQQSSSSSGSAFNGPATTGPSGTSGVLGGPMYGVISKSKAEGVHAFNEKGHYNEWFFIYAPVQDTGKALPNGPFNPKKILAAGTVTTGQPGSAPATTPAPTPAPVTPVAPAQPATPNP